MKTNREGPIRATRATYQRKMEGQLQQWGIRRSALVERATTAGVEMKKKLLAELAQFEVLEAAGSRHLSTVEGAGAAAWDEMRIDLAETWNHVSSSMDVIWARVK